MRLQGKIALITGAGNGIGRATALRFAREGAQLIIADVNPDGLEETQRLVEELGAKARTEICDVGNETDVSGMFARVAESEGRLDCLYNNAGVVGAVGGIKEQSVDDWHRAFRVNVDGAMMCSREAVDLMKDGGSIIITASIAAIVASGPAGLGPVAAYTTTKTALMGLMRVIAYEYGHKNIRCNAILPGSIKTGMTDPMMGSNTYVQGVTSATPLGRFGEPSEIASVALFLASDDSSFVTGESLVVDGGYIIAQGPVFTKMAL